MRLPHIHGIIDRRLLLNYRVDPEVLRRVLPAPFRPHIVRGSGIAGICLIRFKQESFGFIPRGLGITADNAAHRIAVEWEDRGLTRRGVYIPRRDTSSRIASTLGGRLYPGAHHHARFEVTDVPGLICIVLRSDDGNTRISIKCRQSDAFPGSSVFTCLSEASTFFRGGCVGYSATSSAHRFHGLELSCHNWRIDAIEMIDFRSSYFDNRSLFPPGSIEFDCGLLMRNVLHEWVPLATLRTEPVRVDKKPTTGTTEYPSPTPARIAHGADR